MIYEIFFDFFKILKSQPASAGYFRHLLPGFEQSTYYERKAAGAKTGGGVCIAALHRLIEYYDENSIVEIEVDAAWDSYGNPIDLNEPMEESSVDDEFTNHCAERLDYWLTKGMAMNDPMAFAVKGYSLYYTDENEAIPYLAKAAEMGDGRAALFCGSACMNQEKYEEAVEFLQKAYNLNVPSAGWHLSMLYVAGLGVPPNREKAIYYLRHSATLNYPEAVLEMKRIEPQNPVWAHKADSLKIDFNDFPIIPD